MPRPEEPGQILAISQPVESYLEGRGQQRRQGNPLMSPLMLTDPVSDPAHTGTQSLLLVSFCGLRAGRETSLRD